MFLNVARSKGLEPSISAVTGRRFNQLSYDRMQRMRAPSNIALYGL